MSKKNRPYLTRKNLIAIATSGLFAILFVFTGLCLTTDGSILAANNPIISLAQGIGYRGVEITEASALVTTIVSIVLVAVYIIVLTFLIVYIMRFQIMNKVSPKNPKLILAYVGSVLACIALSYGLSVLVMVLMGNSASVGPLSYVIGWSIMIALVISIALAIVIGAVAMFIVNLRNVDKPYKFFSSDENEKLEDMEPEKSEDITASFDVTSNGEGGLGSPIVAGYSNDHAAENEDKARKLDEREKVFPGLCGIDAQYNGFDIQEIQTDDITLEQLATKFRNWLAKEEHLYFDIDTIRVFLAGMGTSHFMILEGLSGTGKSSLPRYFAKFVNADVTFLPVQATWRDKASLLGYFNDFSRIYNETDFLLKLYEAGYNPDRIHMFVLDEMNISRVEYYFADFLSTLEYPEEYWKVRIMHLPFEFVPPTKLVDGFVTIPNNSWFVGTANKDDSTFSIADKVYDRSITLFFEDKNEPFQVNEDVKPITLSNSKLKALYANALGNMENKLTLDDIERFEKITDFIYEEFDVTFGNRILNQIETIVPVFMACGGRKEEALDYMLSRKVIVKLEGRFEEFVKPSLKKLLALISKTYGDGTFKRSEHLINRLIKKL